MNLSRLLLPSLIGFLGCGSNIPTTPKTELPAPILEVCELLRRQTESVGPLEIDRWDSGYILRFTKEDELPCNFTLGECEVPLYGRARVKRNYPQGSLTCHYTTMSVGLYRPNEKGIDPIAVPRNKYGENMTQFSDIRILERAEWKTSNWLVIDEVSPPSYKREEVTLPGLIDEVTLLSPSAPRENYQGVYSHEITEILRNEMAGY